MNMKVQLADRELSIEFAYDTIYVGGKPNRFVHEERIGQAREVTHCLIRDISAPPDTNEAPIIAEAGVVRYYKDPPNRELARKAALAKALEELDRVLPLPNLIHGIAKERRKLFWEAYLYRKRQSSVQFPAHVPIVYWSPTE